MSTQYRKWPWRFCSDEGSIKDADNNLIAYGFQYYSDSELNLATGRLMAAAPELADALRRIAAYQAQFSGDTLLRQVADIATIAVAALAKIEETAE